MRGGACRPWKTKHDVHAHTGTGDAEPRNIVQ